MTAACLDDRVAAFESARAAGSAFDPEPFLPPPGDPLRPAVLCELARVELELSRADGAPRRLDDLFAALPELAADTKGRAAVAFEDFRLRLRAGESPSAEEYARRYGADVGGFRSSLATRVTPPAVEDDFPLPGQSVSGFLLLEELGRGSFARVYLAEQRELASRLVAVKFAPAELVAEAHTLARLNHTNIVPVHSVHRAGSRAAICMPYLGRATLADVISRGPTRERRALRLVAGLADALAHAHARGVLHRDVKPANVLLADDGTALLLDFNLAAAGTPAAIAGTPAYMAPEVRAAADAGRAVATESADVYALALVLRELLAGGRGVTAKTSPAVAAIVAKGVEPDPARRYARASHFRDDLRRHLGGLALIHASEPLSSRGAKWLARNGRSLGAFGLVVVMLTLLLAGASRLRRDAGTLALADARRSRDDVRAALDEAAVVLTAADADPVALAATLRATGEAISRQVPSSLSLLSGSERSEASADRADLLRLRAGGLRRIGDAAAADAATAEADELAAPTAYSALLDDVGRRRYREAIPLLRTAARERSANPVVWALLARAHAEIGKLDEARAFSELAVAAGGDRPWVWFHHGLTLLASGRNDEAADAFGRMLDLRPGAAEGRFNRAVALIRADRPREALPDLDALVADPDTPTRVYLLRAVARHKSGDPAGAAADRAEGIRREPTDVFSRLARAAEVAAENPTLALADVDFVLRDDPDHPGALQSRAHLLSEHFSRTAEAVASLDRLLRNRPDDMVALAGRAVLYGRLKRGDEARRDARRVAAAEKTPGLVYQAGCALALVAGDDAARIDEAVALFRRAFRAEPAWVRVAATDPDVRPIRDAPAFAALVKQAAGW